MSLKHRPLPTSGQCRGFTLVEVLISMLLLLVGLLGVAQLHFSSFQENRNALYRNQATVIAQDLIDRARGNTTALVAGGYTVAFDATSAAPTGADCAEDTGCDSGQVALMDVRDWARNFIPAMPGHIPGLPGASGSGSIDGSASTPCGASTKYDVAVTWVQPDESIGSVRVSACL